MDIKISVIISVYNKLEQLNNILLALNNQLDLPYEVLIVDDGSSEVLEDKIGEIIPELKYNLKHIYQEDIGFRLSASRNNGIIYSKGNYLLFIDQDILFDENFLSDIKNSIQKKEVLKINALYLDEERSLRIKEKIQKNKRYDYLYIKEVLKNEDFEKIKKANKKDKIKNLLYKLKLNKRGAKIIGLCIGCFKEDIIKLNGFDEKYQGWGFEDDDLGNRCYALGLKVETTKLTNIVTHIWHPINTNPSANRKYYEERKKDIFGGKKYKCQYGCDNRLKSENIKVRGI